MALTRIIVIEILPSGRGESLEELNTVHPLAVLKENPGCKVCPRQLNVCVGIVSIGELIDALKASDGIFSTLVGEDGASGLGQPVDVQRGGISGDDHVDIELGRRVLNRRLLSATPCGKRPWIPSLTRKLRLQV